MVMQQKSMIVRLRTRNQMIRVSELRQLMRNQMIQMPELRQRTAGLTAETDRIHFGGEYDTGTDNRIQI